jgi:catechol 2,3-dioxygenase-like lactoylglutathione lyase family enzyme
MPGFNGIAWFEIGTDDPAAAERFYGDVLGWTVAHDPESPTYQVLTTGDADGVHGELADLLAGDVEVLAPQWTRWWHLGGDRDRGDPVGAKGAQPVAESAPGHQVPVGS